MVSAVCAKGIQEMFTGLFHHTPMLDVFDPTLNSLLRFTVRKKSFTHSKNVGEKKEEIFFLFEDPGFPLIFNGLHR